MAGAKLYTLFALTLSMLALVITLSLPPKYHDNDNPALFARCEACHPEKTATVKSGVHYSMKCLECHRISDFQQNMQHNSTTLHCFDCHSDIRDGKMHTKYEYSVVIASKKPGNEITVDYVANPQTQLKPNLSK